MSGRRLAIGGVRGWSAGPRRRQWRVGALGLLLGLVAGAAGAAPAAAVTVDSPWRGWQTVGPPPSLRSSATIDERDGTVAISRQDLNGGVLLLVRDGGRWRHVLAPLPARLVGEVPTPPAPEDPSTLPPSLVGVPGRRALVVQRGCAVSGSGDLGAMWTTVALPGCTASGDQGDVAFVDADRGVLSVGAHPEEQQWATRDGGRTWEGPIDGVTRRATLGIRRDFRAVAGEGGARRLEVTHDFGRTWVPVVLPRADSLRQLAVGVSGATGVFLATGEGYYVSDDDGRTFVDAPGAPVRQDPNDYSDQVSVSCDRGTCTTFHSRSEKGGSVSWQRTWTIPAWVARGDVAPMPRRRFVLWDTIDGEDSYEAPRFDRLWGCPNGYRDVRYDRRPVVLHSGGRPDPVLGGATAVGNVGAPTRPAVLAGGRLWTQRGARWSSTVAPGRGCVLSVAERGPTLTALLEGGDDDLDGEPPRIVERRSGGRWRTVAGEVDASVAAIAATPTGTLVAADDQRFGGGGVFRVERGKQRRVSRASPRDAGFERLTSSGKTVIAWRGARPRVSRDGGRRWRDVRGIDRPSDLQVIDDRYAVALQRGWLYRSQDGGRRFRRGLRIAASRLGPHALGFRDRRVGVVVLGGRGFLTESGGRRWRAIALPYGGRIATGWVSGRDLYLQDATSGDVWRHARAVGR